MSNVSKSFNLVVLNIPRRKLKLKSYRKRKEVIHFETDYKENKITLLKRKGIFISELLLIVLHI